jgi:hypothetical protein
MYKYTILPIVVSLLALAFVDPFMYWYPSTVTWLLLGGLLIATCLYGFFVLTEQAHDEREVSIRSFADRVSCLTGMSLLVMILMYQTITEGIAHPEIVVILVVMVITKLIAHQYACHKH